MSGYADETPDLVENQAFFQSIFKLKHIPELNSQIQNVTFLKLSLCTKPGC